MTSRRREVQIAVGSMGIGGEGRTITNLEEDHGIIPTDMHMYVKEMKQCTEITPQRRIGIKGMKSHVIRRKFMPSPDKCTGCEVETDCILLLIANNFHHIDLIPRELASKLY